MYATVFQQDKNLDASIYIISEPYNQYTTTTYTWCNCPSSKLLRVLHYDSESKQIFHAKVDSTILSPFL